MKNTTVGLALIILFYINGLAQIKVGARLGFFNLNWEN